MWPIFLWIKHPGACHYEFSLFLITIFAALQVSRHLWVSVLSQGYRQQSSSLQGYSLSGISFFFFFFTATAVIPGISVRIFPHETGNKQQMNRVGSGFFFSPKCGHTKLSWRGWLLIWKLWDCLLTAEREPALSHKSAPWGLLFPLPQNKKHWLVIWGDPRPVDIANTG